MAFKEAIAEVYRFVYLHGAVFLFGFGLIPAAQTSYGPVSECAAPFPVYAAIRKLDFFLCIAIVGAAYLASGVRFEIEAANGLAGVPARRRRLLRLEMLAALVFSMASMGIALAVATFVLQVKFSVMACWSSAMRVAVFACLALIGLICACIYGRLVRVALYED